MNKKRLNRLSLLAAALTFMSAASPAYATPSIVQLFKRWWGDTSQAKTRKEKLQITARRIGTVATALVGIGALGYGLWRALFGNSTKMHPLFGRLLDQGTQASMAEAEFIQPESAVQGANECGLFASANARGVEDLANDLRAGRQLPNNAFAQAGMRHAAALRAAADARRAQPAVGENGIDNGAPFPARGVMLEQGDIVTINQDYEGNGARPIPFIFVGRNHNGAMDVVGMQGFAIRHHDADGAPQYERPQDVARDLAQGRRNTLHFLLNRNNGHWMNLSLVHRAGQQPLAVYLDSVNGRPYGEESRALIGFVNGLLEQARAQAG